MLWRPDAAPRKPVTDYPVQAENRDRLIAATDSEKDDVLAWLNDYEPDLLRDAMNETEGWWKK